VDGGGGLRPGECASVTVSTARVTPNVILVVDQSGSMTDDFGGQTRWDALRDALLEDPGGLLREFEGSVEFGLALYTGDEDAATCPIVTQVASAPLNFAAIRDMYAAAEPESETPTGDSIDLIVNTIIGDPDPDPDPTILIVATDGEPDRCEELNPQRGQAEAVAAVTRARSHGIRTFMISVGRDVSDEHMQDMANAGLGRGPGEADAPFWVAGDDGGLRDALRTIVSGAVSCTLELEGRIDPTMACTGTVRVLGASEPLPCNDPNGWRAIDETHIELTGTACDSFLEARGSTVSATFPCETILI
jgi:hypothetical protein